MYIYLYTCIHDIPLCTSSASLMITLCTVFIFTELGVYLSLRLSLYSAHTTHVDADNDDKDGGAEALKDYETPNAPPHIEFVETAISCVGCRMHAFGSEEAPASSSHAASSLSSHAIDAYTRPQHTAHTHAFYAGEEFGGGGGVTLAYTVRSSASNSLLRMSRAAPQSMLMHMHMGEAVEGIYILAYDRPTTEEPIYIYIYTPCTPTSAPHNFLSIYSHSFPLFGFLVPRARAQKSWTHTRTYIYIYMSHSCVPSITQRVGFQHVWRGMLLRISSS